MCIRDRCRTINVILECRYRQCVTFLSAYLGLDVVYEVYNFLSSLGNYLIVKTFIFAVSPEMCIRDRDKATENGQTVQTMTVK